MKFITCVAVLIVLNAPAWGAQPSFQGLGFLDGYDISYAFGVSADGSVVGHCYSPSSRDFEAYRWTASEGMVGLGTMAPASRSFARAISDDGLTVVGYGGVPSEAWRWTQATGMTSLGFLPGDPLGIARDAEDISADGLTIVGSATSENQAYRWTETNGIVGLGFAPGYDYGSKAYGVSADGAVVVGRSESSVTMKAVRWTEDTGMLTLGAIAGGDEAKCATDVSDDGSVVVGGGGGWPEQNRGFRWTLHGGMTILEPLLGCYSSEAEAVSADGSMVVGHCTGTNGEKPFIWDEVNGVQDLLEVLEGDFGLNVSAWQWCRARDISADGLVIVGDGYNPSGQLEAWIAIIPEPATLSLLAAGLGAIWMRKRRGTLRLRPGAPGLRSGQAPGQRDGVTA